MSALPNLLTVKEVHQILNDGRAENNRNAIGINQIYRLIKRDDFPCLKIGKKYFIIEEMLGDWIQNQAFPK